MIIDYKRGQGRKCIKYELRRREHHESATHRKMPPMIKSENSTHMKYYKESATQTKKESVTHMKFVKFL